MRFAMAGAFSICVAALALPFEPPQTKEAPAAYDNKSNGMVDDATHRTDLANFEEVEQISNGLGPVYNAQSCRECHQSPVSGAASQVTELRVGHLGPRGRFYNPEIPIAHGTALITQRSLINDRAICPNGALPDIDIQERVPPSETIRTLRLSTNLLGNGFVEALDDRTIINLAREQCGSRAFGKICGLAIKVPIVEAPGALRVGRFGWKDQHGSLLSFAGDAYINEMGITNPLFPNEVTALCNTDSEPNDTPDAAGLADIDRFARFIRATKAPPRDMQVAASPQAKHGSELFDKIGCSTCHVRSLVTAPAGTQMNGGKYTVPVALGGVTFYPYSDFLLHDVGTGDGIVMSTFEHHGMDVKRKWSVDMETYQNTRNRIRTAPLWGVRMRSRFMHDGVSVTLIDAVGRHGGEAKRVAQRFKGLPNSGRDDIVEFLKSL